MFGGPLAVTLIVRNVPSSAGLVGEYVMMYWFRISWAIAIAIFSTSSADSG